MSEELKPCPFCGMPAQFRSMSFGDDLVRVCCSVCAISTDYYPNNDYSSAANKWQSRPIEDALRAELDKQRAVNATLRVALRNLVEACFRADNEGELSGEIDGSLMDAAWEALK